MGGHTEKDDVSLLENADGLESSTNMPGGVDIEMKEVQDLQADLSHMQSRLWNSDEMTEEEAEEVERQSNLLKIKLAQTSERVREWGMQTGLERLLGHEQIHKWHEDKSKPVDEMRILLTLIPVAILFMTCVLGASTIHFDESIPIPGNLFPLTAEHPIVWPMAHNSDMVEVRFQIMSHAGPGESHGEHGHRRFSTARHFLPDHYQHTLSSDLRKARRTSHDDTTDHDTTHTDTTDHADTTHDTTHGAGHNDHGDHGDHGDHAEFDETKIVLQLFLFKMQPGTDVWKDPHVASTYADFMQFATEEPELIGNYSMLQEEQALLLEFEIAEDPHDQYFIALSLQEEPQAVAIAMHSLGSTGPIQVGIAAVIMTIVFGLIMTEVLHRTMAAMIGASMCMITLGIQNRVPSLSKTVAWMDHGTLGLLWGMMLIVGITMRTGVFEWTGVLACKLSGGDKTRLLLLLCMVTAVLSAFLDNVTTILLIAPVTCKLCKLVNIDPRPFLICEAIFSNVGGTATMIGDPPNIIIGNMLAKYLDFNDFLFNLGPGVIITSPPVFYFLTWYFGDAVKGTLVVDIPKLEKMYPITDRGLLMKCGAVLSCVICSFFLHPVTHLDPAWVSIMGAVWLLVAFDMHHCHEALHAVEWDTLLFFAALFVVVEGVGELGLLRFIANTLSGMVSGISPGGRQAFSIFLICWSSAIFSAFVDNIPFTATMVPVMQKMVADVVGLNIEPLAWALAFGACFGGNGTLIGASANIVMASKAEVEGYHISFMDFFKIGFPTMILSVAIATVYLLTLNAIFWQSAVAL